MVKPTVGKWRESASLIVLAKDAALQQSKYDYRALLFKRPAQASFMPNSVVFPGGVRESADESPLWRQYFKNFGLRSEHFDKLTCVRGPRPSIFSEHGENCLQKEISLRITAIRETFEEVGLMICRGRSQINFDGNEFARFRSDFDREKWQYTVHNDPRQFLNLCEELDVIPDLWSLHEWSAWLTPSTFKKRFETIFYLVALQETPELVIEKNEVADYAWMSPPDYLLANHTKEVWLPPPQLYEMSRFLHFTKLTELASFAQSRSSNGTILMLPIQYKCSDGVVRLLPGDDFYPSDPNAVTDTIQIDATVREFRNGVKKLHREESLHPGESVLHLNFPPPDGQRPPINFKPQRQEQGKL